MSIATSNHNMIKDEIMELKNKEPVGRFLLLSGKKNEN
jgi:hypothetical protein